MRRDDEVWEGCGVNGGVVDGDGYGSGDNGSGSDGYGDGHGNGYNGSGNGWGTRFKSLSFPILGYAVRSHDEV